jgi:hypothetical protein
MFSKKYRNIVIIVLCLVVPLLLSVVEGFNGTMNVLLGDDRTKEITDEYNSLKKNTSLLENEGLSQESIDSSNSKKRIDELGKSVVSEMSQNGNIYAGVQGRLEKMAENGGLGEENTEKMLIRQYGST